MESIEAAEGTPPRKPALLKGGMVVCWIYAVTLALFLAMLPSLNALGGIENHVNRAARGLPAAQAEFLTGVLATSQLFVIPLLVLSIIAAFGLAKDRAWSRRVMMMLLIAGIVFMPPQMANPADYVISIAVAVFGWWYLYRKPNVVAYYDAIKAPGR